MKEKSLSFEELNKEVDGINEQLKNLKIKMLGNKTVPPKRY